jgi:ribosomal protein S18 acetylase RimI-like enzyme
METDKLFFRKSLRKSDIEAIGAIIKSSGFFYQDELEVAVELVQENLDKGPELSGYYFIVAEYDGEVLGYTCFGPIPCAKNRYDLYWIAVHDKHRNLGLGKKLIKETESQIKAMGGAKIFIETSSRDLYEPTRRFYLACGYQVEAVLKEFYDQGDDKVIFVKNIG